MAYYIECGELCRETKPTFSAAMEVFEDVAGKLKASGGGTVSLYILNPGDPPRLCRSYTVETAQAKAARRNPVADPYTMATAQRVRMPYRRYKQHYSDCPNMGDYDKVNKTITVLVPEGRMKPSGTRGQTYKYFDNIRILDPRTGKEYKTTAKAISWDNAKRQWEREGYIVID